MVAHDVVLTFDLEDWFQLVGRRFAISPGRDTRGRLRSQVRCILDLLHRHQARATFFVLGMTAESCPEVVEDVRAAGHEIGSHGYGHQLVHSLDAESFHQDLLRSLEVLRQLGVVSPQGYRAPEFSINRSCFWAFDVLLDCGFSYDSSIFPFGGPRYGIPDFPLQAHPVETPRGRSIMEMPLAVVELFKRRVPIAGGGYWRLLPAPVLDWALDRVGTERATMLYFHPAEFDLRPLNPPLHTKAVAGFALRQNLGRPSITAKLEGLLRRRHCIGAAEYLFGGVAATRVA